MGCSGSKGKTQADSPEKAPYLNPIEQQQTQEVPKKAEQVQEQVEIPQLQIEKLPIKEIPSTQQIITARKATTSSIHDNNDNHLVFSTHDKPMSEFHVRFELSLSQNETEEPIVLFYFDLSKRRFEYFTKTSSRWSSNDLRLSICNIYEFSLFKFNQDFREDENKGLLSQFKCIAISEEKILILGGHHSLFNCIEYNIRNNTFGAKKQMKFSRTKPTLCKYGPYVYAISGDTLNEYCRKFERYDCINDSWSDLKDIPSAQANSTARVIFKKGLNLGPGSYPDVKLFVLGGYSSRDPKKYNGVINFYDFLTAEWYSVELSNLISGRIPTFINMPFVQISEHEILILGAQETQTVFNLNTKSGILKPIGSQLVIKDDFSSLLGSSQAINNSGTVLCLSHLSKTSKKIHTNYTALDGWNLIQ